MKRKILTLALTMMTLLGLYGTLHCQEDIKSLADPAFTHPRRSPVPFMHDQHNEKAKITECNVCHHGSKDGKLDPAGDSTGTKCSECHAVSGAAKKKGGASTSLMRAFHKQCGDCHAKKGQGPVTCAQCHPK